MSQVSHVHLTFVHGICVLSSKSEWTPVHTPHRLQANPSTGTHSLGCAPALAQYPDP